MYHSLIPIDQRPQYLDLLTRAERILPALHNHPECLPIVIQAASAVRDSDEQLSRIKPPLTPSHINTLSALLQKSRTYVTRFWKESKDNAPLSSNNAPLSSNKAPLSSPTKRKSPSPVSSVATQSQPSHAPSPVTVSSVATQSQPSPLAPTTPIPLDKQTLAQYLPTLSHKLQAQAVVLHAKYAELNDTHETLDRYVRKILAKKSVPTSDESREIAYFTKKIDLLVRTIDTFWLLVHAERQALAGHPVTKEYQAFLDEEEKKYPMQSQPRKWGDYTKAEIDRMEADPSLLAVLVGFPDESVPAGRTAPPTLPQLIQARQIRDQQLLRRAIPQRITEQVKQERALAMEELHEWGCPITKKQLETLTKMGIEVPEDYLSPFLTMTEEERRQRNLERDRQRKYENRPASVKMGIARQQQKAQAQDRNAPYKT